MFRVRCSFPKSSAGLAHPRAATRGMAQALRWHLKLAQWDRPRSAMNNREDEEFTAFLKGAVREAETLKYFPTRFKGMLDADGGFATVNRILASGKPSD